MRSIATIAVLAFVTIFCQTSAASAAQNSPFNSALPAGAKPVRLLEGNVKLERTRNVVAKREQHPGATYVVLGCERLALNRVRCSYNEYRTIDKVRQRVRYDVYGKKWKVGNVTWRSRGELGSDPVEAP